MADRRLTEVVVTGLGPVTSIGVGNEALWSSLKAGRTRVEPRRLPVDLGRLEEMAVAPAPPASDIPRCEDHLRFLEEQDCPGCRDLAYALVAIELAISDAGLTYDRSRNEIGVVQVFESPGSERTVSRLFELFSTPPATDQPPQVYEFLAPAFYHAQPFLYVHLVGKSLGLHGFSTSVHNGCASAAFGLELAAQRIREGLAEVVIVAGGEAFDTAVRMEWFRRGGLYACDGGMRPFDEEPGGFYVGEGGSAIVLESAEHAAGRGANVYARYLGGAFAQQSWKETIPDVRSARLRDVIAQSMKDAGVKEEELELIVPHGASTRLSDGYESACLKDALGEHADHTAATVFKPYVGHMLASCGLIEMLCMLLAMKHGGIPATPNTRPDKVQLAVPLITQFTERPVRTAMKLSTGFTGHDAASLFSTID